MMLCRRIVEVAAAVSTALVLVTTAGVPAHAGGPYPYAGRDDIGRVLEVCAQTLTVSAGAGSSDYVGTLKSGEHFTVHEITDSKQYVGGRAHGQVGAEGWVINGWFCNA